MFMVEEMILLNSRTVPWGCNHYVYGGGNAAA
jgi:hypothetical protein